MAMKPVLSSRFLCEHVSKCETEVLFSVYAAGLIAYW